MTDIAKNLATKNVTSSHESVLKLWDDAISGVMADGFRAGPQISLVQFVRFLESIDSMALEIAGADCLDFGCGPTRPYHMAVLLYLLGAKSVVSLDISPYRNKDAVSVGVYSLLLLVLLGKSGLERFRLFNSSEAKRRVADFDLEALGRGDLVNGLPSSIRYVVGDYQSVHQNIGDFNILVSNSVFEHIHHHHLPIILQLLRKHLHLGGYMYLDIDYRDHRVYTKRLSPWQYLIDGADVSPGYINKIRSSEMIKQFFSANFSMVHQFQIKTDPPKDVVTEIRNRGWQGSDMDLVVLVDRLVLQ